MIYLYSHTVRGCSYSFWGSFLDLTCLDLKLKLLFSVWTHFLFCCQCNFCQLQCWRPWVFLFSLSHHCAHSDSLLTLASLRWHPVVPPPSWLEQTRPPSPRETLTPSRPMAAPSICPAKADLHPLERQCITPAPLCLHRYESPGRSVRLGLTCRLTDDFLSSSQPWITGRIAVFRCFHSSGGYYGSVLLIVSCLILRGDASAYWSPCLLRSSESPPEALVTLVGAFVPWTLRERLAFLKCTFQGQ